MATSILLPDSTFEQHYSIADLSELWRISRESVRLLIMHDPGVIRLQLGRKKTMCRYSIPASAARRIHTLLLAPAASTGITRVA